METLRYYEIVQDFNEVFCIKTPLGLPNRPDGRSSSLLFGRIVVVPVPPVFEFEVTGYDYLEPRHFLRGDESVVVSEKFLDALRQAGVDNFEVWPAILRERGGKRVWRNYFAFNEIGLLDAVATEASTGDMLLEGNGENIKPVIAFDEVVFDGRKTHGKKMFRIPQWPSVLYISGTVMDVLRKLAPPEKWGITSTGIKVI
jgi:hypothetical protein